jgi:hypothetical protein
MGTNSLNVIELFVTKEECVKAKLFDSVIVGNPQKAVNFRGIDLSLPTKLC